MQRILYGLSPSGKSLSYFISTNLVTLIAFSKLFSIITYIYVLNVCNYHS